MIAIDAHFTVSSQQPSDLLHYGTRVSYFGVRKTGTQEMRRLHSFHYDMDVSGLVNHPIFHAQPYEGIGIEQLEPIRLLDGFSIAEDQARIPSVQNIRIPTAQMDVLSVCVMLLADHYLDEDDRSADQAFASFILESVVTQSPLLAQNQPRMIEFFEKVQGGGIDIRSSHWYPFDRP